MSWFKSLLIGLTTANKYLKALILVFVDSGFALFMGAFFTNQILFIAEQYCSSILK